MRSVPEALLRSGVLGLVTALSSCGPSMPRGFDSPEPAVRIDAIVAAAAKGDPAATRDLIRMLDSDDPAARMLAIRALERITGVTNGYDYAAPEPQRREAVARWQEWESARSGRTAAGPDAGHDGPSGGPAQHP